jgi:outer membrane protein assembly factor BamC
MRRPPERLRSGPRRQESLALSTSPRPQALPPALSRWRAPVAIAALAALTGCSTVSELFSGDKIDYRAKSAKAAPLEVPPDLTQLARDGRFQAPGGVVSAAATATAPVSPAPGAGVAAGAPAVVAPSAVPGLRIERQGNQRWLVADAKPEVLWPQVRNFWLERGFTLDTESADTGVMETNWAENRAKLPQDGVRAVIGRLLDNFYDTGERDRFRTRIERTATGSEIYLAHRGMEEVFIDNTREQTQWRPRASDPGLEAEFLSRLMLRLGAKEEVARPAVVAAAPEVPARARVVPGTPGTIELDEGFDRAWRRVGIALDRGGFTVEDRDRAAGLYFVRYVPPGAPQREPGWLDRIFGRSDSAANAPQRLRISVKAAGAAGDRSIVSVLGSTGAPEAGENGQRIASLLATELR